jgi:hypothetical protein
MRFGVWTLKLKEGEGESMALYEPRLQTPEDPVPLTGTNKVIKRFNRNTTWVATGLLTPVIFAALMVALQERHATADDLTKEERQTTGDLLLNANPPAISDVAGSNEKGTGGIASGRATSVDRGLTPEINHPDVHANANLWSSAHWQRPARVIRPKIHVLRYKSSLRARLVDVKVRLITLWHQSFVRSERSRTWTGYSNKGERKKVGYTAETNH